LIVVTRVHVVGGTVHNVRYMMLSIVKQVLRWRQFCSACTALHATCSRWLVCRIFCFSLDHI